MARSPALPESDKRGQRTPETAHGVWESVP